ncbi:hypothetical protein F6Q07_06285 [Pectobacterium parmentieri]|uniref:Integron gene cassette protein n=1 Tax=Pectobacterium parmentieri TaxID=1905730 RepID=A0A0H3I375_PECPM|nr:hypothetical protein [Pectobacterium parmentieri]AFI89097.1 Putative integron gene cassette protein [Pectobacterium parmentieri]AYH00387.1 hypothetical protein C5E26_05170 [Pectobacterium parmentieri]AYH04833.1 hypothetical protein C5E25_05335 [Pectobacterium parmentieri]AYH13653.1 hypothetical protein C5E23_05315 [Pectobacterium parmentieri]AYH22355.1 hypothetical protein C5E21_05310 [Pectobacterium parmentieri]
MGQRNLREVLKDAENIDWHLALYLPKEVSAWNLDSLVMIEDPDDVDSDDPDEDPDVVKNAGYRYVMGIQSIQGIVNNAKLQLNNISDESLFTCFIFYFERDAFIEL